MTWFSLLLMPLIPGQPAMPDAAVRELRLPERRQAREAVAAVKPRLLSHHPALTGMHREAMKWRARYGKGPLQLDEECCRIAQRWANYMAANGAFHHGGGEQIIAYGSQTIPDVFVLWMNSPGHASWILSSSKKCGWGYQRSADGTPYWVGVFR